MDGRDSRTDKHSITFRALLQPQFASKRPLLCHVDITGCQIWRTGIHPIGPITRRAGKVGCGASPAVAVDRTERPMVKLRRLADQAHVAPVEPDQRSGDRSGTSRRADRQKFWGATGGWRTDVSPRRVPTGTSAQSGRAADTTREGMLVIAGRASADLVASGPHGVRTIYELLSASLSCPSTP
jgi:hypothetical protein